MKINPWFLFTSALLVALVLPSLIQDGMFMDGMLYTSVSHNLALGKGTFWYPEFSQTSMTFFHEQPPLVFGIQSLFFRLLGDSMYVERFYSFLCTIINGLLIAAVWKQFHRESESKNLGWLPVISWIIMPVTFWACANNMQENTMSIFVLLATLFLLKGITAEPERKKLLFYFPAAGVFLVLAALSKGFPGLFPLAVIPLHWFFFRRFSFGKAIVYSLIPLVTVFAVFAFLLSSDHIYNSLHAYLFDRVVNSIQHVSTQGNRFHLLSELVQNLLPVLALVVGIVFAGRRYSAELFSSETKKQTFFFLGCGLAGALPLMVTLEQRGFYLVTALPFFAFAFASLAAPALKTALDKWPQESKSFKTFRWISLSLLIGAIAFSATQTGKTRRDQELLADVYRFGAVIPRDSKISIDPRMWNDWALQTYMMRYFSIHLDQFEQQHFLLLDKSLGQKPPAGYSPVFTGTKKYDLYEDVTEHPSGSGDGVD
ncbi:MAG: hypothetical protein FD123_143 [Bacteroidetes bacterium]|nr:MAG: hypothetical protein FD123_143 [Bacteroidota bacterium]